MKIPSLSSVLLTFLFLLFPVRVLAYENNADSDWQAILNVFSDVEVKGSDSRYVRLLKNTELSDLKRRRLGMEFWENYPNDPRRFSWLRLTIEFPPHYAIDIDEWAIEEAKMSGNSTPIDESAVEEWNRKCKAYLNEFYTCEEVSSHDVRAMDCAVIQNEILSAKDAMARSKRCDLNEIKNAILNYAEKYPKGEDALDIKDHYWRAPYLVYLVLYHADSFNIDTREQMDFLYPFTFSSPVDLRRFTKQWREQLQRNGVIKGNVITWSKAPDYPLDQPQTWEDRFVAYRKIELVQQKYCQLAKEYWMQEQYDPQRFYEWLTVIAYDTPWFYKDLNQGAYAYSIEKDYPSVAVDVAALDEFDSLYQEARSRYMNSSIVSDNQRKDLRKRELFSEIIRAPFLVHHGKEFNLREYQKDLLQFAKQWPSDEFQYFEPCHLLSTVFTYADDLNLTSEELMEFVQAFKSVPGKALQEVITAKEGLLKLKLDPMGLNYQAIDGRDIDLLNYKGKYVLLELWSTSCSACIADMPHIQRVYKEFQDKGFEVISLCVDGKSNKERVIEVQEKLNLNWPIILLDNEEGSEMLDRYGFVGVPQYLLINPDGLLISSGNELRGQALENTIDNIFRGSQN